MRRVSFIGSQAIRTRSALNVHREKLSRGIGRSWSLTMDRGEGCWMYDTSGKKYLDFTSGIGVLNTGHCHPTVVKDVQAQAAKLVHSQVVLGYHEPMLELVERLLPIMPGEGDKKLDSFFFWNSGSEAVEAAVKLARVATRRQNIVVMQGGYHGRTMGSMAMTTSKTVYKEHMGPLMPGVFVTPFPYARQLPGMRNATEDEMVDACLDSLDILFQQQTIPDEVAAIVIEPVLGEGGYIPAPKRFLEGLRERCDKHGILLVFDEVQCGFGRTGHMFASDPSGVVPDVIIAAKGIASGYPLSAVISRKELTDKQVPGSVGGTYAGNAVSCAAANATMKVFEEEKLLDNVQARSKELFGGLRKLQQSGKYPITDVRGAGLMIGVEFDAPKGTAQKISQAAAEHGLLLLNTSAFETVRMIPPLILTADEAQFSLTAVEKALDDVFAK